jgi:hypothetical protein
LRIFEFVGVTFGGEDLIEDCVVTGNDSEAASGGVIGWEGDVSAATVGSFVLLVFP